jgi:Fe-S-cluster containining protein
VKDPGRTPQETAPSGPQDSGPDLEDLTPELRQRLLELVPKLFELGMGCTYSAESPEDGGTDSEVDCAGRTSLCRAVCCSFRFALTREEAESGAIRYDREHPFFIARDPDGYCLHHDREQGLCTIWDTRPLRCRRYTCLAESRVWKDGDSLVILPGTFDHLPPPKGGAGG